MNLMQRRHAWLRRLALMCAALVLAVTSLSAFIRLSQAGLGCDDWPQCYGSRLRGAQQGQLGLDTKTEAVAAARLAHRAVAVLALLAVLTMLAISFGNRPWLQREGLLALVLLALALGLAVLGRWTAGARVPAVAMGNLVGGMLMLALCWRLAATGSAPSARPAITTWARMAALLLLCQLAIGALVSASYAGLSCAGIGDCLAAADTAGWPWRVLDPWREPVFDATPLPMNPDGALAQLLHRAGAVLVLAVLAPLGWAALRGGQQREGASLLVLLILQVALGLLMTATALPITAALAHNIVAALLLATVLRLA